MNTSCVPPKHSLATRSCLSVKTTSTIRIVVWISVASVAFLHSHYLFFVSCISPFSFHLLLCTICGRSLQHLSHLWFVAFSSWTVEVLSALLLHPNPERAPELLTIALCIFLCMCECVFESVELVYVTLNYFSSSHVSAHKHRQQILAWRRSSFTFAWRWFIAIFFKQRPSLFN